MLLVFLDYDFHIRRIGLGWIQRYRFVLIFLVPRHRLHVLNPHFIDLVRQLNLTGVHTQPYCALCLRPLRQRGFPQDTIVFAARFGIRQRKLPRQVDSSEVECFAASTRSRYSAGGRLPSASSGRSSL